jgi:adhesin HecA-like repeat protein
MRRSFVQPDASSLGVAALFLKRLLAALLMATAIGARAETNTMLIDDFSREDFVSKLGTQWRAVSDRVMGGVSQASLEYDRAEGKSCLRLSGVVRLDNDGGFIQAALDLALPGQRIDASAYTGIRLVVRGNSQQYSLHLRTPDAVRPWQSYRVHFYAGPAWETVDLPFEAFVPHRLEPSLDTKNLTRMGLVAIGRNFTAELLVLRVSLYR